MKLILLIVAMAATVSAQVSPAMEEMSLGIQTFRAGRFAASIENFTRAKQLDPTLVAADLHIGLANAQQFIPNLTAAQNMEFAKKAIAAFEAVLAKEPSHEAALTGLASIYQNSRDLSKAREIHLRLTRVAPQNPVHFYAVGSTDWIIVADRQNPVPDAEKTKLIADGLSHIDVALRLNPTYEEAMTYKNLLLRQKAGLTRDPAEAARLTAEADLIFNRTLELRRLNQAVGAVGTRGGVVGGVLGGIIAPPPPPPPPPPGASAASLQIGADVAQRNLVTRVEPKPSTTGVKGNVLLQVTISRTGAVTDIKVLSGHPALNESAIEAVRQWKYTPYQAGGQPVDVTTTVVLSF